MSEPGSAAFEVEQTCSLRGSSKLSCLSASSRRASGLRPHASGSLLRRPHSDFPGVPLRMKMTEQEARATAPTMLPATIPLGTNGMTSVVVVVEVVTVVIVVVIVVVVVRLVVDDEVVDDVCVWVVVTVTVDDVLVPVDVEMVLVCVVVVDVEVLFVCV